MGDTLNVPSAPYATIQDAINAASDGDEVVVAPGTYPETINFNGKGITLRSSGGAEITIIDGAGLNSSVVLCVNSEGPQTVLEGFTITGGTGIWSSQFVRGGGVYMLLSSPTVRDCVFTDNSAELGGGLSILGGSPTVSGCTFASNTAHSFIGGSGGGLYNELGGGTVSGCMFVENRADRGGGVENWHSTMEVMDCTFDRNEAGTGLLAGFGGGMANVNQNLSTIAGCTFRANRSLWGGGMANQESDTVVTRCRFDANIATIAFGGGMYNDRSNLSIADCVFTANRADDFGGAMAIASGSVSVRHGTFVGNWAPQGRALGFDALSIYPPSDFNLSNSILWNGGDEIWNNDGSTVALMYSNVEKGTPGTGNINAVPRFFSTGDFRLLPNSPGINAGDPNFLPDAGETDIVGDARMQACRTDMGAYESPFPQVPGDFDGNRRIDLKDYAALQSCMGASASASARADACVCAFDSSGDETVDVEDYAGFHARFGDGREPAPRIDRFMPTPGEWVVSDTGLTEVHIGFNEAVFIPQDAVDVWTVGGGTIDDFTTAYDDGSHTLTVQFAAPLRDDRVTVVVDFTIMGLTGSELDGEIFDPANAELPSGDGIPGGQGVFRIHVLQGDANRDGLVDANDQALVTKSLGLCDGNPDFDPRADLNADDCVDDLDENIVTSGQDAKQIRLITIVGGYATTTASRYRSKTAMIIGMHLNTSGAYNRRRGT